ncbi:MAG: hypothetical protein HYW49_00420 [Deltaproteobacteria bacterium]|nr:hypothetical protein [Deltaproteobacteria bacterium]
MKHKYTLLSILAFGTVLCACHMPGITKDVEPASFDIVPVTAPTVSTYEAQDVLLSNNKMFLWRDDMSSAHVATAQRVSRELDALDERAFPLSNRKFKLEKDFEPVQRKLRAANGRLSFIQTRTAKLNKDREAELQKPEPSQDKIRKIDEELASLQNEKPAREAEKAEAEQVLKPVQEEISKIDEQLLDIERSGTVKVREISDAVVWFQDQDLTTVSFRREEDGSLYVAITDWKLSENEAAKSFSTADGTIRNVKYVPRGGIYEFEVADENTTYWFKVSRFRPNDPFGRMIFTGDLEKRELLENGATKVTKGIAKFIDRKN